MGTEYAVDIQVIYEEDRWWYHVMDPSSQINLFPGIPLSVSADEYEKYKKALVIVEKFQEKIDRLYQYETEQREE